MKLLTLVFACLLLSAHAKQGDEKEHPLHNYSWDYSAILAPSQYDAAAFQDLPGFTRSFYRSNYALITHESHVFASNPLWKNATTAHLISPVVGSSFAMYLVQMKPNAIGSFPSDEVERFFFILDGTATVAVNGWAGKSKTVNLHADQYAYVPYETKWSITSQSGGSILVYERVAAERKERLRSPVFQSGSVHDHPVLPVDGEMFVLRKLLPQTSDYFFNIHVMDFLPGEHLNVKEVHYNQHGLLLLAGKGIYRLGDEWMPVKAGDAIWMAPYIPQWYAALGSEPSRYIIYKDTIEDPVRARRP